MKNEINGLRSFMKESQSQYRYCRNELGLANQGKSGLSKAVIFKTLNYYRKNILDCILELRTLLIENKAARLVKETK